MKTSIKHYRIDVSSSVSLVKDDDTKLKNWRYRNSNVTAGKTGQCFVDYPFNKFESLEEFKRFVREGKIQL